jgi:hypothetical protein
LSHILFINYSLHNVDLFHTSCRGIYILITFLAKRTKTHLPPILCVLPLCIDYCMCLQTLDSILTSVTVIRQLWVCTMVIKIRGQHFGPPIDWSSIQTVPCCLFLFTDRSATNETRATRIRWRLSDELVASIQCSGMSLNEVRATRIGRQLSDKLVACNQCSIFSSNKM